MFFNSVMSYRVRLFFGAALVVMCQCMEEVQIKVETADSMGEQRPANTGESVWTKVLKKGATFIGVAGWVAIPTAVFTTCLIDGFKGWDGNQVAQITQEMPKDSYFYIKLRKPRKGEKNDLSEKEGEELFKHITEKFGTSGMNVPNKYYFPTWDKDTGKQVKVLRETNGKLYSTFSEVVKARMGEDFDVESLGVVRGGVFPFIDTDVSYTMSNNLSTPVKKTGLITAINISICSVTMLALIDSIQTPNKWVGAAQLLKTAGGMLSMALMTNAFAVDVNQMMHVLTLYACMGLSLFGITPSIVATLRIQHRFPRSFTINGALGDDSKSQLKKIGANIDSKSWCGLKEKSEKLIKGITDDNVDEVREILEQAVRTKKIDSFQENSYVYGTDARSELPKGMSWFETEYGFRVVKGKRIPSSHQPAVTATKLLLTGIFVTIWKCTDVEWNAFCELLAILCANSSFYTHYMKLQCYKMLTLDAIPTLGDSDGEEQTEKLKKILAEAKKLSEDAGVELRIDDSKTTESDEIQAAERGADVDLRLEMIQRIDDASSSTNRTFDRNGFPITLQEKEEQSLPEMNGDDGNSNIWRIGDEIYWDTSRMSQKQEDKFYNSK